MHKIVFLFKHACLLGLVVVVLPIVASAQESAAEDWNAKFQATYVWQEKQPFAATYSGPNSLSAQKEESYSFTATAFLGFRPWAGGEFYFNPEAAQGRPLSRLTGLGGFTNGEIARTSGSELKFYRARLFLRQSWGVGGGTETVDSDINQLAGAIEKRRLVTTVGNLSVLDIFDANAFCRDPRTQFLNWALMTHGAYDFAADARGYTWGLAVEYYYDDWVLRGGRFIQPKEPNQLALDSNIWQHYGDQIEVEHAHRLADQEGRLRLLIFRNRAKMSRYQEALDLAAQGGNTPDINAVRTGDQTKRGFGINLEQAVTRVLGVFARASWADGMTEAYAFTEIDRSISSGALVKGSPWGRGQDTLGVALVRNYLSAEHRNYLASGGLGFFIGDGQLNYQPETILEMFYSLGVTKKFWVSVDYQYIRNPAYNADRGPVNVGSIRLHTEF